MLCSRLRRVGPGKDGPLVGIAGSLFFGRGRGTKTPDARRAQHAQNASLCDSSGSAEQ